MDFKNCIKPPRSKKTCCEIVVNGSEKVSFITNKGKRINGEWCICIKCGAFASVKPGTIFNPIKVLETNNLTKEKK